MITPGWRREVCPQCHFPGRVGERVAADFKKRGETSFTFGLFKAPELGLQISWDICDNCGVLYAYKATKTRSKISS